MQPEFREREDVAEEWEKKLTKQYLRKRYPWMIVVVFLLKPFRKLIERRLKDRRLDRGL